MFTYRPRHLFVPRNPRWPNARRLELLEDRILLTSDAMAGVAAISTLSIDTSSFDEASLLVRFRDDSSLSSASDKPALRDHILGRQDFSRLQGLTQIQLKPNSSVEAALAAFRADPAVAFAEPNYRVQIAATPSDNQFGALWGLNNVGQTGGLVDADIDAVEAWETTTGSGNMIVAVIDTGVDYLHEDLAANMWVNPGEIPGDGLDNDGNGFVDDIHGYDFFNNDPDPMDDHNHGTHVAGTIGAVANNQVGIAGLNWNVQIMALKFLDAGGGGSFADAIRALDYAVANGAAISNNSWGATNAFSQGLFESIQSAREADHIFVAAAGNGNAFGVGQNNDAIAFYPANFDSDNIVSVAALDHNDDRATFSNFGATTVDIGAPGVGILSTTRNNTYSTFNGTSMATPHVAGLLALVRDLYPERDYQDVIETVLSSGDPIAALEGITVSGARINAAAALLPDTTGPHVKASDPGGEVLDPVSAVHLRFSESIDASTFTSADITSFIGPEGPLDLSSINVTAGSTNRRFDVSFPSLTAPGLYRMVIGPNISDRVGNSMDQNMDGTGGTHPDDAYTLEFTLGIPLGRFDFGSAVSPVSDDYVAILPTDVYVASVGYGWLDEESESLDSRDRTTGQTPEDLNRDFNFATDMTFAMDLLNGTYNVTVHIGDASFPHDDMGVYLEGEQVDTVSTAIGQFESNTYQAHVTDGQLTVRLADLGGSDAWAIINGLDVAVAGVETAAGPRVISGGPTGETRESVDRFSLTFSHSVQNGSFTVADVTLLEGPSGGIAPIEINKVTDNQYEVVFAPQIEPGDYELTLSPGILNALGSPMDQNANGIPGEDPDDQFAIGFTLLPPLQTVGLFDFGTTNSPLEFGYTAIDTTSDYDSAQGYGWLTGLSGLLDSRDRLTGGSPVALMQDFVFSTELVFAANVLNGTYLVEFDLGDTTAHHDQMGIYLEGIEQDVVSTDANQFLHKSYQVDVLDEQLSVRLADLGGTGLSGPYVVLNALKISLVGDPAPGISVEPKSHLVTTETGGHDTFEVVLNVQPSADVTLDFTTSDSSEGVTNVTSITFTPSNWNVPQVVTVTGVDDPLTDGHVGYTISMAATSSDAGYDGLVAGPLTVTNLDDDALPDPLRFDMGIVGSPIESGYTRILRTHVYDVGSGFGWIASESGPLDSRNRGFGDDPLALTMDFVFSTELTFAADLANGWYDVTLTMGDYASHHEQVEVSIEEVVVGNVSTAAAEFLSNTYRIQVSDGQLKVRLDDLGGSGPSGPYAVLNAIEIAPVTAGLTITPTSGLVTSETGGAANFSIVLNTPPQSDVTIQLSSSDVDEGIVAPAVVTFTNANWNTAQQVTVTGVDDAQSDGDSVYFILSTAVSGDSAYHGLNGDAVRVLNLDDEPPIVPTRFDMGTVSSAVENGFARVDPTHTYSASSGFGWVLTESGALDSRDRGTGQAPLAVTRDFVFSTALTFVADVADGMYDVTLTFGDANYHHDQMALFVEGIQLETINTAVGEFVVNTYRVTVDDGQLTVLVDDQGGSGASGPYAVLNSLEFALVGPGLNISPTAGLLTSENGDTANFTISLTTPPVSDVTVQLASTAPGEGIVSPTELIFTPQSWHTPQVVTVTGIDDSVQDGSVTYSISSIVSDGGEDYSGVRGDDVDVTNLDNDLVNSNLRFDMGTLNSPLEGDFARVSASTTYSPSVGYGWLSNQSGALDSRDRLIGVAPAALTRDFVFSTELAFAVDLSNGNYEVTLTMGDATYHHDQMAIHLEGVQVDLVSTAVGEFVENMYEVEVSDGQLTVFVDDVGGTGASGPYAVFNGLEIVAIPQGVTIQGIPLAQSTVDWDLGARRERRSQARQKANRTPTSFDPMVAVVTTGTHERLDRMRPNVVSKSREKGTLHETSHQWEVVFQFADFLDELDGVAPKLPWRLA